ncbi:MAG: SUMF1/EgtB/PvdO family nonheme iron enzyme [Deltaproteobacteria bacterium]|nr:SUMF1/EgtB/PvdO family nonheme iron enzyme [Deltaproteobacteria bacterium]
MAETKPANECTCTNPFVKIEGGPFQLGSPGATPLSDEQHLRSVIISDFEIQQHEVSIGEVRDLNETAGKVLGAVLSGCKGTTPDTFFLEVKMGESESALQKRAQQIAGQLQCNSDTPLKRQPKIEIPTVDFSANRINRGGDTYPVQGLKWQEAMDYCVAIGATLATAAQLEYVSDTGGATPNAVTDKNSNNSPAPVCGPEAERRRNRYGVGDIEGNLWELTSDQYDPEFYSRVRDCAKDPSNPVTKPEDQKSEVRGGSFDDDARDARAANRDYDYPSYRYGVDGFRCAR